jgi:hypothetical protein
MKRRDSIKAGTAAVAASLLPLRLASGETPKSVVWEISGKPEPALRALFSRLGAIAALIEGRGQADHHRRSHPPERRALREDRKRQHGG